MVMQLTTQPSLLFVDPSHPDFPFRSVTNMLDDIYDMTMEWELDDDDVVRFDSLMEASSHAFVEVGYHQYKDDPSTFMYEYNQDFLANEDFYGDIYTYLTENTDLYDMSFYARYYCSERKAWASDLKDLFTLNQYFFVDDQHRVINPPIKEVF